MNHKVSAHLAGISLALLLAGCSLDNDDEKKSGGDPGIAMTEEKYRLIAMAIDEMVEFGEMPPDGFIVVADQSTLGEATENYLSADESLQPLTALDTGFPYDHMRWSQEEADMMFAQYYRANVEATDLRAQDMSPLQYDVGLLMHEQFQEYNTLFDPWTGWTDFYADYPEAVGYMRIGVPAVSREAGIALVHVDYDCGFACGIGFYTLFRLEGGEWQFVQWYADRLP